MAEITRSTDDAQRDDIVRDGGPERFPDWYPDPRNSEDERFWNGTEWTNLTRAAPRLADFLGPIEPTLLAILGEAKPTSETSPEMSPEMSPVAMSSQATLGVGPTEQSPLSTDHDWDDRSGLQQVQAFMAN